jgi:hypothetical protein
MKYLCLTSCNRIKQVLLSLTINSHIIKEDFGVIIADCSSINESFDSALKLNHDTTKITEKNYSSDISLFEKHVSLIPNIKSFQLIHHSPKMDKHGGEASLIKLGLSQIISTDAYCLKLTGVSILNYDIFVDFQLLLESYDIFTFRKLHQREIASTRIFGCRPKQLHTFMEINDNVWFPDPYQFAEIRFDKLLRIYDKNKINHCDEDESKPLFDRSVDVCRKHISQFIFNHNIPMAYPIIQEFNDGNIYD